ncbi:phosphotransferase enzyme family protein [Aquabacterium sp. OR-4]|uniref:phosphotransferase enzyme family protein n=1 Tax=Aquabacterium sp. OR-4 TaxID=2978127 RepID=UPI0021B4838A|nr:phosphotransferase [Aquabacterium sp. OR-4]MDT7834343.1 phosphotransferase [Aquabacterium sp. OR-4]
MRSPPADRRSPPPQLRPPPSRPARAAPSPLAHELPRLLAAHGLRLQHWRRIAALDCTVLRLRSSAGHDLALRIYPPGRRSDAHIAFELALLADLAAEGWRVPRPWTAPDATTLPRLADGRVAVLLDWLDGRCLDAAVRPAHLQATGRLIAAIHHAGERVLARQHAAPPPGVDLLGGWAAGQRRATPLWPLGACRLATAVARELQAEIAGWPRNAASWGLVHGDMHLWNLLFRRGQAGAIDFTDCGLDWRAQDLASVLQYLQHPLARNHDHRNRYPALRDALLAGYDTQRGLWPLAQAQTDALRVARWLGSVAWVLDDWPRPTLRAFGPGLLRSVPRLLAGRLLGGPATAGGPLQHPASGPLQHPAAP